MLTKLKKQSRKRFSPNRSRVELDNYRNNIIVEICIISESMTQLKNMMKLENLQQIKEIITQQAVCQTTLTSKIIIT